MRVSNGQERLNQRLWISLVILTLAWLAMIAEKSSAQDLSERQVLVLFSGGTASMPDEPDSAEASEVLSPQSGLAATLSTYGISTLERAFPDFDRADTIVVGYNGQTVPQMDWSKVFLLTAQDPNDVQPLINDLLASEAVVIAEPNGLREPLGLPVYPSDPLLRSGAQRGMWTPAATGAPDGDVNAPWAWWSGPGFDCTPWGVV